MKTQDRTTLLALIGATLLGGLSLAACNTVEGIGQDVEALGEAIEEEADDARD